MLITPSFSYGTVGVELPPPKRLAHVLIVRKHSDLSWVAHRGVRPQLDWPQKQSGSSVKWMVYGIRLCYTMVLACVRYEYIHAGSTVRHRVLAVVIHYAFFVRLAVVRSLWRRVS